MCTNCEILLKKKIFSGTIVLTRISLAEYVIV